MQENFIGTSESIYTFSVDLPIPPAPAPINGKYTDWSEWETCDKTCGGGKQTRTRKYIPPKHGGSDLPDINLSEVRTCNSQACNITITSMVEYTKFPKNEHITGFYMADTFDEKSQKWYDLSPKQNHITKMVGVKKEDTSVTGTINSHFIFPTALDTQYSVIYIAKYNGTNKKRILTGTTTNWLTGFWSGLTGVAYHGQWITSKNGVKTTGKYTLSIDTQKNYYANGQKLTINTEQLAGDLLSVNKGEEKHSGEKSDWAIMGMVIYNTQLDDQDVINLQKYISNHPTFKETLEPFPQKQIKIIANSISGTKQLSISYSYFGIVKKFSQDVSTQDTNITLNIPLQATNLKFEFNGYINIKSLLLNDTDIRHTYIKPPKASFLRIRKEGTGVLNIMDVEVYAVGEVFNFARNRVATASSKYFHTDWNNPQNLTDQNWNTGFHTNEEANPWVKIEISDTTKGKNIGIDVRKIVIKNRPGPEAWISRLNDCIVELLDINNKVVWAHKLQEKNVDRYTLQCINQVTEQCEIAERGNVTQSQEATAECVII